MFELGDLQLIYSDEIPYKELDLLVRSDYIVATATCIHDLCDAGYHGTFVCSRFAGHTGPHLALGDCLIQMWTDKISKFYHHTERR